MSLYEKLSAERKASQGTGNTPEWMTTGGYQMYMEKLQYQDETFADAFVRIATEVARQAVHMDIYGRSEWELFIRFYTLLWKGWLCPATPVLANTGLDRGLPVACSGSYIPDSIEGFFEAYKEAAVLTKTGHGCSCYLGDIRPRGSSFGNSEGISDGVIPVIQQMLATVSTVSQGSTRRGATAFYIPIDHGDVREVLDFQLANPKRLQIGYVFPKAFIDKLEEGDVAANQTWKRFMRVRATTGKAYMLFPDKANDHYEELDVYFDSPVQASNLCTEIMLPSTDDETFSCVISSVNLAKYDEWSGDELFYHDCILFLNGIIDSYLERIKGSETLERVRDFTMRYRALGLGTLGFHSLMQKKGYALDSDAAYGLNLYIFEDMYKQCRKAGDAYYNATVMAVAPNVSSALVAGGVSQGIEPWASNVFTQETAAGDIYRMNPQLLHLMKVKGIDTEENIDTIKKDKGSIQGNPLFTDHEQSVFRTAYEYDQRVLVNLADCRGRHIDQGQSLNLFFPDDADEEYVTEVHKALVKSKYVKSAYYFNTEVGVKASTGVCMMCEA